MKVRFRIEWFYYSAAAAALTFSVAAVTQSQPQNERRTPPGDMVVSPYDSAIAASGVIEPSSRTLTITPDTDGIINAIMVEPGQKVTAGAALFSLDDRLHRAAVEQAMAAAARALAEIDVRQADARAAAAAAEAARSRASHLQTTVERYRPIASEAMSAEDFDKLVSDAEAAAFAFRQALHAADAADAAAAAAKEDAALAQAALAAAQVDLERTVMRAPIDATVLGVDARIGEAVRPADRAVPFVSIGDIDTLHARVEIDETQTHRFHPNASASAYLRGGNGEAIPLVFVSMEPQLKPKSAFRDGAVEYADARVLEARYRIDRTGNRQPLYVGQMLDIFITDPTAGQSNQKSDWKLRSRRDPPRLSAQGVAAQTPAQREPLDIRP